MDDVGKNLHPLIRVGLRELVQHPAPLVQERPFFRVRRVVESGLDSCLPDLVNALFTYTRGYAHLFLLLLLKALAGRGGALAGRGGAGRTMCARRAHCGRTTCARRGVVLPVVELCRFPPLGLPEPGQFRDRPIGEHQASAGELTMHCVISMLRPVVDDEPLTVMLIEPPGLDESSGQHLG